MYFLTEDQEIVYLTSPNDTQSDVPAPIVFNKAATDSIQYTTFGTFATKAVTDKQTTTHQSGPLVLGHNDKTAIKAVSQNVIF